MAEQFDKLRWEDEDEYWRTNFQDRPYVSSEQDYRFFQPSYRFGFDAANRYQNRNWSDVESELSSSWSKYEHRGTSTWEQVKHAVRDAWDRGTGKRPVGAR